MSVIILAIESSCDDTGAAVIKDGQMLSNVVASQRVHEKYGGVVPEVASRAHQKNIIPVVDTALKDAGITKHDLSAIAVTRGPGLMGALIVGVSFAKALSLGLGIPLIEVNHMEAHILAHFIESPRPEFPFLCLTVSGGHTQIVRVNSPSDMTLLGETLDDAAGEAFDKTGKMMGLPYPAGPWLDKHASQGKAIYTFPKADLPGLDFSFSGLKTSVLYFLQKQMKQDPTFIQEHMADICASVQSAIVEALLDKIKEASLDTGIVEVAIAGGVSANSGLRRGFTRLGEQAGWKTYIPRFEFCTDNAAMIAMSAHFKYLEADFADQYLVPVVRYGLSAQGK